MTDLTPLTDDELAAARVAAAGRETWDPVSRLWMTRLLATVDAVRAERHALRSVVRLWHDCFVKDGSPFINLPGTDMADWDDEDWAGSGWAPAEAAAIRAALEENP